VRRYHNEHEKKMRMRETGVSGPKIVDGSFVDCPDFRNAKNGEAREASPGRI